VRRSLACAAAARPAHLRNHRHGCCLPPLTLDDDELRMAKQDIWCVCLASANCELIFVMMMMMI
jgi:hypothetical protein